MINQNVSIIRISAATRPKNEGNMIWRCYLVFLGIIGVSSIGQYLIIDVIHMPFFFIEWVYIPLLYKYRRKIKKLFGKKVSFSYILVLLLLLLSAIYGIVDTESVGFLNEYRSIVYLLLVYRYINRYGINEHFDDFLNVCFYATLAEFFSIAVILKSAVVSGISCIAISVSIIGYLISRMYLKGIIAFLLSIVAGVLSGYRVGVVIPLLCLGIAGIDLILSNYGTKKAGGKIRKIVYVGIIVISIVFLVSEYDAIIQFIAKKFNMDMYAIYRISSRMKATMRLDFSASQDSARLNLWILPFKEFLRCILPHGLTRSLGYYIDVPVLFLYDTLGSIGAIIVICFFSITVFRFALIFLKRKKMDQSTWRERIFSLCIYPLLMVLLIVNGSFLKHLYQAIITGVVLGIISNNRIKSKRLKHR